MRSELLAGSSVSFPPFTGERVYMREFVPGSALPVGLERWQRTVDAMLRGVHSTGRAFLMIDQAEVVAGATHRRPGLHVDGYWHADVVCHGGQPSAPGHRIAPSHQPAPAQSPVPGHLPGPSHGFPGQGQHLGSGAGEALIIAASVEGCEAFEGDWEGVAGAGGDCSAVPIESLTRRRMPAGVAWIGETGALLHSALPMPARALRTVVRINVQGWVIRWQS